MCVCCLAAYPCALRHMSNLADRTLPCLNNIGCVANRVMHTTFNFVCLFCKTGVWARGQCSRGPFCRPPVSSPRRFINRVTMHNFTSPFCTTGVWGTWSMLMVGLLLAPQAQGVSMLVSALWNLSDTSSADGITQAQVSSRCLLVFLVFLYRVGQNHTFIGIYGVQTVFLAGKSLYIRSLTVQIYGSGHPYSFTIIVGRLLSSSLSYLATVLQLPSREVTTFP